MTQVLEYRRGLKPLELPRWAAIIFAVLNVPLLPCPGLEFAFGRSPWRVMEDFELDHGAWLLLLLALSFFLAWPIMVWKLRLFFPFSVRRWEHWTFRLLALLLGFPVVVVMTVMLMMVILRGTLSVPSWQEMLPFAALLAVWVVVGLYTWLLCRWHSPASWRTTGMLYGGFLGNASLCLTAFAGDAEIGWKLTLAASILLLPEMVTCTILAGARRGERTA